MTLWLRLDDPAEELPPPVVSPNKLVHHCQEDLGTSFPQISKVEASGEPRVSLVTPEDRWKRTFIGPFSSSRVSVVFKCSKAMDTGLPPVLSLLTLLGGPGGCSPCCSSLFLGSGLELKHLWLPYSQSAGTTNQPHLPEGSMSILLM